MKKKMIFATTAVAAAAFALATCANTKTGGESPNSAQTNENKVAANLTAASNVSVNIDYSIHSYKSIQDFSYQLFGENMDEDNPVLSPASAYLALAMAGFGADGNTKTEFYQVLGEDMMALSDDLMHMIPAKSDVQILTLANSAWIDDQFLVDEKWIGTVKSLLDAEAYQTDLSSVDAMDSMNYWVKENTNGMIDKMLENPLDKDSRLALFNTIYFKAKWSSPFEAMATYSDDFTIDASQSVKTDMMHKYDEYFDYISNDFAEGLIFPYRTDKEDNNTAFIALKPSEDMDVREMVRLLNEAAMAEMLAGRQTLLVNTKLPKFEIAFEQELNDSLKNMGLNECFDGDMANFDLMGQSVTGNPLYISLVKQKAKIIVDEEGTEAAAVTEVFVADNCALIVEEPLNIFFDEPFLYIIMDMDREIPLFIGILDNPAAES